jgi:chaperonin cofactor prefoldin
MNQIIDEQDKNKSLMEEIQAQQIQINSLANSLQQILVFLQDQKSRGSVDMSNLSSTSQESIKYLNAVLNEFGFLKQEISTIKPGFILLKESIDKVHQSQTEELKRISKDVKALQSGQVKIYTSLTSTKEPLASASASKIRWKSMISLERIVGIIAISISIASIINIASLTSKIYDDNESIKKDIKTIQNYTGIKKKK